MRAVQKIHKNGVGVSGLRMSFKAHFSVNVAFSIAVSSGVADEFAFGIGIMLQECRFYFGEYFFEMSRFFFVADGGGHLLHQAC